MTQQSRRGYPRPARVRRIAIPNPTVQHGLQRDICSLRRGDLLSRTSMHRSARSLTARCTGMRRLVLTHKAKKETTSQTGMSEYGETPKCQLSNTQGESITKKQSPGHHPRNKTARDLDGRLFEQKEPWPEIARFVGAFLRRTLGSWWRQFPLIPKSLWIWRDRQDNGAPRVGHAGIVANTTIELDHINSLRLCPLGHLGTVRPTSLLC